MNKKPKYVDNRPHSQKYEYKAPDDSILFNDDKMLRPIRLSLPKPPKLHLIDGYGLPPEEQVFKKLVIPPRLRQLEERVIRDLKEQDTRNKAFVITNFKIQELFWRTLEKERRQYVEEIDFIKKIWWHRLHGYWFFNNGKPTYIDGWHFYYLNFWYMPEVKGGYPDYRDADRKEFIFFRYTYTTTETFSQTNKDGMAESDRYGKYVMKEAGRRVCYGLLEPKNRRAGDTSKGLCIGHEIVSKTIGTDGFGIMSYTADNAKKHFSGKLVSAWSRLPCWMKPYTPSGNDPNTIIYNVPSNEYVEKGLQTEITYATSADSRFYDGKKLIAVLLDEEGKDRNTNIAERWRIIQNCLSQGNGSIIHGWAYHPSTVEEYNEGGKVYRDLANQSDFYRRNSNGQTMSGLFRLFIPAYERLDGFIDRYGYAIDETPKTPVINAEGKLVKTGAIEYLNNRRKTLLKDGSPEALAAYRAEKKQFPMEYSDCWLGEAGDAGFNIEKIDQRRAELSRSNPTKRGNYMWEGGRRHGRVIFLENPEGKFIISKELDDARSNAKVQYWTRDPISGEDIMAWKPLYAGAFTASGDEFDFATKREMTFREDRSRKSKGGGAVFWERDKKTDSKDVMSEWESYRFVCTYLYRPQTDDEYKEDMLKMCVYWGALFYPERNKTGLWKYFITEGYAGYLKYDVDEVTGKIADKPGHFTATGSKDLYFKVLMDYIEFRVHKECHDDLLEQITRISGPERLKDFDLFVACALCLVGSRSSYARVLQQLDDSDVIDLTAFVGKRFMR